MKNLDFEWLTDEFMLYCRSTQLREKTMSSYEQTLHLFGRWLSDELNIYTVDKITEQVIRRYIDDLMTRGKYTFYVNDLSKKKNYPNRRRDYRKPVSVTTINNYIRNIRVFFNWMERDYIIRKNHMKKIRQLKNNRQAKVFLSDEDLKKLLSKFDKSYLYFLRVSVGIVPVGLLDLFCCVIPNWITLTSKSFQITINTFFPEDGFVTSKREENTPSGIDSLPVIQYHESIQH